MWRAIFAVTGLALVLTLVPGCGSRNSAAGQPRLANPDDPRVKDQTPLGVGGGAKGAGAQANPF